MNTILFVLWVFWPAPWDLGHYGTHDEHLVSGGWSPAMVYDTVEDCQRAALQVKRRMSLGLVLTCLREDIEPKPRSRVMGSVGK